jgi:hypothetical protein
MKLCMDCKHFVDGRIDDFCARGARSRIRGGFIETCSYLRTDTNRCGPFGDWWEKRPCWWRFWE